MSVAVIFYPPGYTGDIAADGGGLPSRPGSVAGRRTIRRGVRGLIVA
jgi:hypothetical protein